MGKSTAGRMLKRLGLPLFDADAYVHGLLGKGGGAVGAVAAAFPGVRQGAVIDRARLGALVFADAAALERLTAILHPRVREAERAFLKRCRAARRRYAVLDIPLLYETGAERLCDRVIVIRAPEFLRRQRVLTRPGLSPERLAAIRARQMPDREKCRRADYVIQTGLGLRPTLAALKKILRRQKRRRG